MYAFIYVIIQGNEAGANNSETVNKLRIELLESHQVTGHSILVL